MRKQRGAVPLGSSSCAEALPPIFPALMAYSACQGGFVPSWCRSSQQLQPESRDACSAQVCGGALEFTSAVEVSVSAKHLPEGMDLTSKVSSCSPWARRFFGQEEKDGGILT